MKRLREYDECISLAENGQLPCDFDQWDLADENGLSVAHVAAWNRSLPDDFCCWRIADIAGRTVAHYAAESCALPVNFDQWDIMDIQHGWTVAHEAAENGTLPILGPNAFEQWDMATNDGWTVAHSTANRELLPANFSQWGLTDNEGVSVLECAMAAWGGFPPEWKVTRPLCKSKADWDVFKKALPEIYFMHEVVDQMPTLEVTPCTL